MSGESLRQASRSAALRGVEYLIRKSGEMPPEWGSSIFARLYRIAPTPEMAARLRSILDQALQEPLAEIPSDAQASMVLNDQRLRAVLNEIWRRKLTGESWKREAAAFQFLVDTREEDLWKLLHPNQHDVFLHLFHRIGITTRRTEDDLARQLRRRWANGNQPALLVSIPFMYNVTHVFYVESGYFQRRLNPERYPIEIEIFDRALARYVRKFPANSNFVDISAEILASRRLLGLPESDEVRAMTRLLLARQNPDGSWLEPEGFKDYHATASAVHAFIEYPAEFRSVEARNSAGSPGSQPHSKTEGDTPRTDR